MRVGDGYNPSGACTDNCASFRASISSPAPCVALSSRKHRRPHRRHWNRWNILTLAHPIHVSVRFPFPKFSTTSASRPLSLIQHVQVRRHGASAAAHWEVVPALCQSRRVPPTFIPLNTQDLYLICCGILPDPEHRVSLIFSGLPLGSNLSQIGRWCGA
jgi:hypothetical protein